MRIQLPDSTEPGAQHSLHPSRNGSGWLHGRVSGCEADPGWSDPTSAHPLRSAGREPAPKARRAAARTPRRADRAARPWVVRKGLGGPSGQQWREIPGMRTPGSVQLRSIPKGLSDRSVGHRCDGSTAPGQHQGSRLTCEGLQLGQETRLADARLSGQQHGLRTPSRSLREGGLERRSSSARPTMTGLDTHRDMSGPRSTLAHMLSPGAESGMAFRLTGLGGVAPRPRSQDA